MACYCHNCFPDYKFNQNECMFCHTKLQGEGKLKSPNGARVCQNCIKNAVKILDEDKEKVNE
jgi:hypothetical protein